MLEAFVALMVWSMYRMYGEDDARAWARMVIELAS